MLTGKYFFQLNKPDNKEHYKKIFKNFFVQDRKTPKYFSLIKY